MEIQCVNKAEMALIVARVNKYTCSHRKVTIATVTMVASPVVRDMVGLHT